MDKEKEKNMSKDSFRDQVTTIMSAIEGQKSNFDEGIIEEDRFKKNVKPFLIEFLDIIDFKQTKKVKKINPSVELIKAFDILLKEED